MKILKKKEFSIGLCYDHDHDPNHDHDDDPNHDHDDDHDEIERKIQNFLP